MKDSKVKISAFIATSIDGFIARKDGSLDWLDGVQATDEDCGFQGFYAGVDTIIMGRKTYEVVSSFSEWPYTEKRVIVLSYSLSEFNPHAECYAGDIKALIERLASEGVKHIWVDGGICINSFVKERLIDEMTLSIIPVILGSGIRLLNEFDKDYPCKLMRSQAFSNGIVQTTYGF